MAWRNAVQTTLDSNIPQNIIDDPVGFMAAFDQASSSAQMETCYKNYFMSTWNGIAIKSGTMTTGKVCGDNSNYFNMEYANSAFLCKMYINGAYDNVNMSTGGSSNDYAGCYVALVDDETQKGYMFLLLRYRTNEGCGTWGGNSPKYNSSNQSNMYTILTANEVQPTPTTRVSGGGGGFYGGYKGVIN